MIKHQNILDAAVKANQARGFYAQYPEHPKAYGEAAPAQGEAEFNDALHQPFKGLLQTGEGSWGGDEVSPYTQEKLGITYPLFTAGILVKNAQAAAAKWQHTDVTTRADVLIESLEAISGRFFAIAHATMHTSGQPFMMSFQASGPHANDRALEAIALGYQELSRYPSHLVWEKPMGKMSVKLDKQFKAIPKGIGLVIGCSTFPVWNSLPGIYANLIAGNPVIVKPHPGAILPIAIVVAAIQRTLQAHGQDPQLCQLAADTAAQPITKQLAEHPAIKLVDYTGGSAFGAYVEGLAGKTVFTEKAGVNSVIIDSVTDLDAVLQNLAFSVSLYSGQMCTAPQNIFISSTGVRNALTGEVVSYDDLCQRFSDAVQSLVNNPKMGAGTLGAIQNNTTLERAIGADKLGGTVLLAGGAVANEAYANARSCAPSLIQVDGKDQQVFENELFGPLVLLVKTRDTADSLRLAKALAEKHGAITCAAYSTDPAVKERIVEEMNSVFTPVSLNFTGPIWVNQHAAFSDFHVTGGNPAGNASFTNPDFISRRFVWVGNREVIN